jgi:hypothetical protein
MADVGNLYVLPLSSAIRGGDSVRRWSKTASRKRIAILVVFSMFAFAFSVFFSENVQAADDDQYLWGMIFDSDGNLLPYDTEFRVWVRHNNTWKGFPSNTTWDPAGTMGGFYSYTLPWLEKEDNWSHGDEYRIQIDCMLSGDLAENATSNGTGSPGEFSVRGSYNNIINWSTGGGLNNSQQWDVICSNVDLIPTNIELDGQPYSPPMTVAPFATVTFSATVSNVGKTDIFEPNTIVLRNQSGVLDQDTAVSVSSGSSVGPFSFTWDAPASGYFCFNISVDYNDNVTETNESNNHEMVCFSVGEPDLTPSGVGITTDYGTQFYLDVSATNYRSNPIPITPGTTATIVTNVSNVGTLSSGPSDLAFYNTDVEGGQRVGAPFSIPMVSPLALGAADGPFVTNWIAPLSPGFAYVNITADYSSDVVEINELNNTFILRFLVGKPDYIPLNVTPLTQDVTSNTSIPIDVLVSNVGLLDALVTSTIAFYNQSTPLTPFVALPVANISAGQTSPLTYSANWIAPSVTMLTTYYVEVKADYTLVIDEENEDNNVLVIEFNVFPGPITTLVYGDPNYVNGTTLYITSSTSLDFTVQSSAPWAYAHYSLDGGASVNYSSTGTFTISGEGLHDLTYYSIDSLDNVEQAHTQTIIVDDSPPITTLNIFGLKFTSAGTTWIRSNTALSQIFLNWTRDDEPDLAVGREETKYRIYQIAWGAWIDYTPGNPIDLGPADGLREIEWFSADRLGNNETTQSASVYVDDTAPVAPLTLGEPNYEREGTIYIEPKTELTITADDGNGCGVSIIEYRLDNEQLWRQYVGSFKIEKFGKHTIYFRGTDNLDNTGDPQSQEVFVLGPNYKPMVAIIFIIIMIIVGAVVGYKRPLLMARKKQREFEETLLKEEEETELASEPVEEEHEDYEEEPIEEAGEYEEEVEEYEEEPAEEVDEYEEEEVQEEVRKPDDDIIDLSDRRVV